MLAASSPFFCSECFLTAVEFDIGSKAVSCSVLRGNAAVGNVLAVGAERLALAQLPSPNNNPSDPEVRGKLWRFLTTEPLGTCRREKSQRHRHPPVNMGRFRLTKRRTKICSEIHMTNSFLSRTLLFFTPSTPLQNVQRFFQRELLYIDKLLSVRCSKEQSVSVERP